MRRGRPGRAEDARNARRGASSLFLALAISTAHVCAGDARAEVLTLPGSERRLSLTSFTISGAAPRPAVLVLSGTRGFGAKAYKRLANTLNAAGIDAFFVHFLSEEDIAEIERAASVASRKAIYARRWDEWMASVRAAVETIETRPLYRGRLGLLGVSLGAAVATAAAADNPRVAALVAIDGSASEDALDKAKSIPPLLAIWGSADQLFSVAMGERLRDVASALGVEAELEVYEREPHAFFLEHENKQAISALTRVREFLSERLQNPARR